MLLEKIKSLCKSNNISVAGLEKSCGLGNATIRGWENSNPSVRNIKKVANHFGVPVDYFLDDTTD